MDKSVCTALLESDSHPFAVPKVPAHYLTMASSTVRFQYSFTYRHYEEANLFHTSAME